MTHLPVCIEMAREMALLDIACGTSTPNPYRRGTDERELFARAYRDERRDFRAATAALKGAML